MIIRMLALSCFLAMSAVALAGDGYENPAPSSTVDWPSIGVTAVATLAIGVLGFKSTKKSHLD